MVNEQLQLHLVRLSLRELGGKAPSKDIVRWIGTKYVRMRVGLKKARYLLDRCADIERQEFKNDVFYWYTTPTMRIGDIIRLGLKAYGSRERLADEMDIGVSKLSQWAKGISRPTEEGLEILDEFARRHNLWECT